MSSDDQIREIRLHSVSVVLPCYNANETLELQLEALANQVDAPPFDVIVVDNASPISPRSVVESWQGALSLTLIEADGAQGVAYARNVGLASTQSDFVVFVDADDCAAPTFMNAAYSALLGAPFVTGNVRTLDESTFAGGLNSVWQALEALPPSDSVIEGDVDLDYPIFMGGASAVHRKAALEILGFDQAYVPGAEDNDFGLRALREGYVIHQCPSMILAERRRKTSKQVFARAYHGGVMHMRLCAGHNLWEKSPHLKNPTWWVDTIKLPITGAVALAFKRGQARQDWFGRAGLRLGQSVGFAQYKVAHRPVPSQLGLGLMAHSEKTVAPSEAANNSHVAQ